MLPDNLPKTKFMSSECGTFAYRHPKILSRNRDPGASEGTPIYVRSSVMVRVRSHLAGASHNVSVGASDQVQVQQR